MPAQKKGTEVRLSTSIRIEPNVKESLIRRYGTVQKALDFFIFLNDRYPGIVEDIFRSYKIEQYKEKINGSNNPTSI